MKRFVVSVERTQDGWSVAIEKGAAGGPKVASRAMVRLPDPAEGGRRGEVPHPPDPAALRALADEPELFDTVFRLYARLLNRDQGHEQLVDAFGSYLFECLLGDAWEKVREAAGDDGVELALRWPAEDTDLTRLPWEMMRGPARFLAEDPRVAITRLVAGSAATTDGRTLLPRVLFVVGTHLGDPDIRPGTEYIGLLRQLRARGHALNTRLVLDGSLKDLQDALRDFEPSVVHLICHGGLVRGQPPTLQLRSDLPGEARQDVDAGQLFGALESPGPLPPIVVINACHSGQGPQDRVAAPYAATLVARGVPVAVGMWGRVADRACRLFTRRFYEALLSGDEAVIAAASEGRRAGFRESAANPSRAADWAFPTIFLGDRVPPGVALDAAALEAAGRLHAVERRFNRTVQPAFCDRIEFLDSSYPKLFMRAGRELPRVLAIREREETGRRCGKTRLLEELAGRAVADGHVPCLVSLSKVTDAPGTAPQLARKIAWAMSKTREYFEVAGAEYETVRVLEAVKDRELRSGLSGSVREAAKIASWPEHEDGLELDVLGKALREDLRRLGGTILAQARGRSAVRGGDAGASRVVLLLDQVHEYGEHALRLVLDDLLGTEGAGTTSEPVPVIFACSTVQEGREDAPASRMLREYFENRENHVAIGTLTPFPDPNADPLPYEQYLLGLEPPVVVRHDDAPRNIAPLYRYLWTKTKGMPEHFNPRYLEETIEIFSMIDPPALALADDEEVLARMRRHGT